MQKIGIVVPVYKVKKDFLDFCINSLVNQSYPNIQIILVDDGSPDDCGNICEKWAKKDRRIKVVHHKKNKGLPSARNTGIDNLDEDCQWVTFVDSDDWLENNTCEGIISYIQNWNRKPDLIIFSGCKNYPNLEMVSEPAYSEETWFIGKDDITKLQIRSLEFVKKHFPVNSINLDSACWRFVSVDFLRKNNIRFIDIPYREDGLFFLYTTQFAESIVYVYEPYYHYRSTNDSMVNMYRKNADIEHKIYLDEVWKFIKRFDKDENFIKSMYYAILLSMEICITQKFFNNSNKDSIIKKHTECENYFKQEPYCNVFSHITLSSLRKNHLIKALLIKTHLYLGIEFLRGFYNLINKKGKF